MDDLTASVWDDVLPKKEDIISALSGGESEDEDTAHSRTIPSTVFDSVEEQKRELAKDEGESRKKELLDGLISNSGNSARFTPGFGVTDHNSGFDDTLKQDNYGFGRPFTSSTFGGYDDDNGFNDKITQSTFGHSSTFGESSAVLGNSTSPFDTASPFNSDTFGSGFRNPDSGMNESSYYDENKTTDSGNSVGLGKSILNSNDETLEEDSLFNAPLKPLSPEKLNSGPLFESGFINKQSNDIFANINDTPNEATKIVSPKKVNLKNSKLFKIPRPRKYNASITTKHLGSEGPLGKGKDEKKVDEDKHKESEEEILLPQKKQPKIEYLDIDVGDPMKIGDITNAHIIYQIKTKNKNKELYDFETATVTRRYKDFLWIYHQLVSSYPGRIIPPPPTKQTYIGRFNENFIENRRLSLQKMLTRISNNPILNQDENFISFLTNQEFDETKLKDSQSIDFEDGEESVVSDAPTSISNGFMSSLFSISTKIEDPDDFFVKKNIYIDELEFNLKNFQKSIELIGQQRGLLLGIYDEITLIIEELASIDISKKTSDLLNAFAEVQRKLHDNLERVNLQDQLTLGFTIEEYLRIISSIKSIFDYRLKIYSNFQKFKSEFDKKSNQLIKFENKYKQQVEKIKLLKFEIEKLGQKVQTYEKLFETITKTTKEELEKFESERIDDFRNSVEIFIESSIESQKEAIELYETFYERQGLANI